MYYNRLLELALSRFKWDVPTTIDTRYLELTLFSQGQAVFFDDDVMGSLALNVMLDGQYNVYGVPLSRTAYSPYNNYRNHLDILNSVIVYNNYLHKNTMSTISMFARRLYNLDRVIDVNANAQKTPVLIICDENERLTMVNLYKQWDGNEPVIFGNRALHAQGFQVLKTDAPYVADRIYQLKSNIWNEALTALGISNVTISKKERLITDEVQRSQGGTIAARNSYIKARQEACERCADVLGWNISCEWDDSLSDLSVDLPYDNINLSGSEVVSGE